MEIEFLLCFFPKSKMAAEFPSKDGLGVESRACHDNLMQKGFAVAHKTYSRLTRRN